MSAADGVACRVDIVLKVTVALVLNVIHPFSIQLLDTLPDLSVVLVVVGILMFGAPVAKVS